MRHVTGRQIGASGVAWISGSTPASTGITTAPYIRVRLCEQRQSPMVIYTRDEPEEAVGQFGHRRRESEVSRSRAEMAIEFADRAILVPAQRASAKTAAVGKRQLIFEFARILNDPEYPAAAPNALLTRRVLWPEPLLLALFASRRCCHQVRRTSAGDDFCLAVHQRVQAQRPAAKIPDEKHSPQ